MKNTWNRILLALSAVAGVAFFFVRFFRPRVSPESTLAEDLIAAEKSRLNGEKLKLVEEEKAIDEKVYSDEEIEKKYNKVMI